MSSILRYSDWILSSRGLMARPILPNNEIAVRSLIGSISYEVKKMNAGGAIVSGNLTVADVMYETEQPWHLEDPPRGFTFLWDAPGTLFSVVDIFRIKLVFTIIDPCPEFPSLGGKSFVLAFENDAKDPLA